MQDHGTVGSQSNWVPVKCKTSWCHMHQTLAHDIRFISCSQMSFKLHLLHTEGVIGVQALTPPPIGDRRPGRQGMHADCIKAHSNGLQPSTSTFDGHYAQARDHATIANRPQRVKQPIILLQQMRCHILNLGQQKPARQAMQIQTPLCGVLKLWNYTSHAPKSHQQQRQSCLRDSPTKTVTSQRQSPGDSWRNTCHWPRESPTQDCPH